MDQIYKIIGIAPTMIKMDIEGSEVATVGRGIENIEEISKNLRMFICAYHTPNDEMLLKRMLSDKYNIDISQGYRYCKSGGEAGFRRGIIRAERKSY